MFRADVRNGKAGNGGLIATTCSCSREDGGVITILGRALPSGGVIDSGRIGLLGCPIGMVVENPDSGATAMSDCELNCE